jgi:A/G-specific adenine glycosylase
MRFCRSISHVTATNQTSFAQRLLKWWQQNGRQDLPWQHPRTAYRVWVSEVMLQQTQVSTVIPYFERWMKGFPDIPELAESPQDQVLSLWSGLGYYARARNLHKTAIQCVDEYNGALPETAEQLSTLPGIGLSTANAIVSQSQDVPAAVLDGNVRRVLARHSAIEGWAGQAAVGRRMWQEANDRLPKIRGADYTQAIMDLGALVCTRTRPQCESCPVMTDCQALQLKQVDRFPWPRPSTRVRKKTVHLLILRDEQGRVLLEKRPPSGIWGGLWSLPEGDSIAAIETELGLTGTRINELSPFEHRLSHVCMTIHPALCTSTTARQVKCSSRQEWFDPNKQSTVGLPKPVSRLLTELNNGDMK